MGLEGQLQLCWDPRSGRDPAAPQTERHGREGGTAITGPTGTKPTSTPETHCAVPSANEISVCASPPTSVSGARRPVPALALVTALYRDPRMVTPCIVPDHGRRGAVFLQTQPMRVRFWIAG